MNKNNRFVGVITQVTEKKDKDDNPYILAIIDSPSFSFEIRFHHRNLSNGKEISDIADGKLITFEQLGLTAGYERTTAIECLINCEKEIEENILDYSPETIGLILQKVSGESAERLNTKIANKTAGKIKPVANAKNNVDPQYGKAGTNNSEQSEFILPIDRKPEHALLWKIFDDNNQEYNIKLLVTLSEGIKKVDGEQIYDQTKMLLQLNDNMGEKKINDLNFAFYRKSSEEYQFLLWLEGFVDFCPTPFLSEYFNNASLEIKKRITTRLGFDRERTLFKDLSQENANHNAEVLFTDIRASLLHELDSAKISIRAAIAWFTNHELFNMLCLKLDQKVKVELIIINDYINNWEFGLPFQKFINLGGKLYLSEHPGLMHHKFCIVDNRVLINGSYNWTYYAEWFNKENIMLFRENHSVIDSFNAEFDRIKSVLGQPVSEIKCFEENDIQRFERRAYREYLSSDLTLKADQIKPKNAEIASQLASQAIMFNPENTAAVSLSRELEGLVRIEQHSQVILNTLNPSINEELSPVTESLISDNVKNLLVDPQMPHQTVILENETLKSDKSAASELNPVDLAPERVEAPVTAPKENSPTARIKNTQEKLNSILQPKIAYVKPEHAMPMTSRSYSSPGQNKTINSEADFNLPVNIDSYSITVKETKAMGFENLQVGIALDTSGSMESLYKNGTVQKVVERLLALSLTISQSGNLDIWTFANTSQKQETVNKNNFADYVKQKGFSGSGGTEAFKVIDAILKNYLSLDNFKNPVFAIILTDGDVGALQTLITASAEYPVFWQFVGLGYRMDSLEKLNRENTNMSFFLLNDIETIEDEQLYSKLLNEFPGWFKKRFPVD